MRINVACRPCSTVARHGGKGPIEALFLCHWVEKIKLPPPLNLAITNLVCRC